MVQIREGSNRADVAPLAMDVSLRSSRLSGRCLHGDAQCARTLLHPGDRRSHAQRGHDRLGILDRAVDGKDLGKTDLRAGYWRGPGWRRAGGVSASDVAPGRFQVSMDDPVE